MDADLPHPLLASLNAAQQRAVTSAHRHVLAVAGPGSGKTSTLVAYLNWQQQIEGLLPSEIMAVTFTNKAAMEMRHRMRSTHPRSTDGMWIGTFHSISHRLLRLYHDRLGLAAQFTILDIDDGIKSIKKILQSLNLDEQRYPAKALLGQIQDAKENGLNPDDLAVFSIGQKQFRLIYQHYQDYCKENHFVDFTDLIKKTIELLNAHQDVKSQMHAQIQTIAVDEFQDINPLQYQWLESFYHPKLRTFYVGDDDQSIYSWRGSRADLMLQFQTRHADSAVIPLERNYRSTPVILEAANAVIAHNQGRMHKKLWTEEQMSSLIRVFQAHSDHEEAEWIMNDIKEALQAGHAASEIAILYRSNAQSRLFEEQAHRWGISYRIYGGQRFFDRQEIKDALAYLRVAHHMDDLYSLERIMHTPSQGLGPQTLKPLNEYRSQGLSFRDALNACLHDEINTRSRKALKALQEKLNLFDEKAHEHQGVILAREILEISGLWAHWQNQNQDPQRLENIEELLKAIAQFCDQEGGDLLTFLQHAALMHLDDHNNPQAMIHLMTLHAAKGLEFDRIYLVGMEEDLLPHRASLADASAIEEERRLCYVGMTRARQSLTLSYAEMRQMYGQKSYPKASRFLHEIPKHCLDFLRPHHAIQGQTHYQAGQRINHPRFGQGVILCLEGHPPYARIHIEFDDRSTRWFLAAYAPIEAI